MKFILNLSVGVLLSASAFAQSQPGLLGAWKGFSDPDIFSSGFTHQLNMLPLEGSMQIGPRAWSGDYWASKKGSINYRWNAFKKVGWDYKSPERSAVMSMSPEQIAELAPSEKFDLYMGRYDYPLKKEVASSASKLAQDWAGICHGWAPASIFHNEPTPKTVTNPDGIVIPFGSADIKALLSYFYAFYHDVGTNQMGLRCFFGSWMGGARGCNDDLNAGAFHIVITNKLGLQKEGFMMDLERFREVWNQPVVAYKSRYLAELPPSKHAASTAVKEIRVATELYYVDESAPTWNLVMGTEHQKIGVQELAYRIELNANNEIVGGEWESKNRPDFLWNKPAARPEEFRGLFTLLPTLLND